MSQFQPANLANGVFAERAAVWFGWVLLASLSVVVLFASLDQQRRSQIEGFAEVTAVGDKAYFKAPDPMKPLTVAVTFHGQPLTPLSPPRHVGARDSRMLRAGQDDSGVYRIYVNSQSGEDAKRPGEDYFLKTGPDEYLEVRPERVVK